MDDTRQQRLAEDSLEQITEAIVWIDAADSALCAALLGNGLTLTEAIEHAVRLHGRARARLELAMVA